MPVEVQLEWYEVKIAEMVGTMRRHESQMRGSSGAYGRRNADSSDESLLEEDIATAGAEMVVAKYLNRYWGGHVNVTAKGPDVGQSIQVRSISNRRHCLIVRPDDLDEQYFFLVYRDFPRYEILGYIKGEDAKVSEWRRSPNDRSVAFFVPQNALRERFWT